MVALVMTTSMAAIKTTSLKVARAMIIWMAAAAMTTLEAVSVTIPCSVVRVTIILKAVLEMI